MIGKINKSFDIKMHNKSIKISIFLKVSIYILSIIYVLLGIFLSIILLDWFGVDIQLDEQLRLNRKYLTNWKKISYSIITLLYYIIGIWSACGANHEQV